MNYLETVTVFLYLGAWITTTERDLRNSTLYGSVTIVTLPHTSLNTAVRLKNPDTLTE